MDQLGNLYLKILLSVSFTSFVLADSVQPTGNFSLKNLGEVGWVLGVAVVCICLLLTVFVISLCGGCTPMEVGSDGHEAAGGRKSTNYGQHYDSVATDVNTHVMSAGTTLPHDPYQHEDQSLPYALHPQGVQTANAFAGYQDQSHATGGYSGPGSGNQHPPAGNQRPPAGNQHRAGAHVPATGGSEPPPPNYYEATGGNTSSNQRPTAPPPAQSYGW